MTTELYNGLTIDLSRDALIDPVGHTRLRASYMLPTESSPQHRFAYVSKLFSDDVAHAQRLYDYASKLWFGYSTPVLSMGRNATGLPISCYLAYVEDSKSGLVNALSHTNWLSMLGGGVGVYWSTRGEDEKSVGVIPHMKVYDAACQAYKQGTTRRGSYAMYLDIDHPDIVGFMEMRKETGDQRRRCLNLHNGVNVSDKFMQIIERSMIDPTYNDDWELKDPISGRVHRVVSARALWASLLTLRAGEGRGEPYIHFIDTTNRAIRPNLRDQGYRVSQSNLCSEITLHTDAEKIAVCCLSSLNLDKWDHYKDNPQFFEDVLRMLDNVLEYFIVHAPTEIAPAVKSAVEERSIGLGVMGFHSYLQQKSVPFESAMAKSINLKMFRTIHEQTERVNLKIGAERGSPKMMEGTGLRWAHTTAVAPTATNALICGNVSPSIEPWHACAFRQDTMSGTFIQKNQYLDALLRKKSQTGECEYDEAWLSVIANEGRVSTLECLTEYEKDVFKAAADIDMLWAVEHAADRQQYIDQSQSFNIFIHPDISVARLHAIHFTAWKKGVKTMYYCRSEKLVNTEAVSSKVVRRRLEDDIAELASLTEDGGCVACEG